MKTSTRQHLATPSSSSPSIASLYTAIGIWFILCVRFVFHRILGSTSVNEGDVLPLARQFVDPQWMPQDWYLNQPAGYRFLFSSIAGHAIGGIGWVATSVIGRSLCFALLAIGLVWMAQRLKLSMLMVWFVSAAWVTFGQSAIAGEWIAQSLEAKAMAYGFVFLAIGCLLHHHYRWMGVLLGVATSFHVLVGGYAFLAAGGVYGLNVLHASKYRVGLQTLGLYIVGSSFAIPAVIRQVVSMFQPQDVTTVSASAIYVFLRLPHHLNPLSWDATQWIEMALFLVVFNLALLLLRRGWLQRSPLSQEQREAVNTLATVTAFSLVPFVLGLLIAPFDMEGKWLQFYPFRFGDVMLPLSTYLLMGLLLQNIGQARSRRMMVIAPLLGLGLFFGNYSSQFLSDLSSVRQFPSQHPEISRPWYTLCQWVRQSTPEDATLITSPADYEEFTWLTERATVAKLKFLPQSEAGIQEWAERLRQLSDRSDVITIDRHHGHTDIIREQLREGYTRLQTDDAIALMDRYDADYFVTERNHQLDLPVVYRNRRFLIYQRQAE
jgi:hypothetical protein